MEALEFTTTIKNNQILVPDRIKTELETNKNKSIRVIVLIEEDAENDFRIDPDIKQTLHDQFLKGYADSDSIYDNL